MIPSDSRPHAHAEPFHHSRRPSPMIRDCPTYDPGSPPCPGTVEVSERTYSIPPRVVVRGLYGVRVTVCPVGGIATSPRATEFAGSGGSAPGAVADRAPSMT